jgi:uncharacterized protein YjiS (DUF1127 family)
LENAMTIFENTAHRSRPASLVRIRGAVHHLLGLARTRRALRRLDDHMLRDIGLTRHEAETEASRSLWDAPLHWHR